MPKTGQSICTEPAHLVTALFALLPLPVAIVDETGEIVIANSHFRETFPDVRNLSGANLNEITVAGRGTFNLEVVPLNDRGFEIVYGIDVSNEICLRNQLTELETQVKECLKPIETDQSFDINETVRSVARVRQPFVKSANIGVSMNLNSKLPLVKGDPKAIEKVVSVLFANAEHASLAGDKLSRSIIIRTWLENARVRVSVSDSGCGMGARDPQTPSISVAIGICAEIINDHGGEFFCWNSYTAGSTYTIELPADVAPD